MSEQMKDAKPSEILPAFMRADIQRAIDADKTSTGMRLNDSMLRCALHHWTLERVLMLAERADQLQLIVEAKMEAMSPVDGGILLCGDTVSHDELYMLKRCLKDLGHHRTMMIAGDIKQLSDAELKAAGLVKRAEHDEALRLLDTDSEFPPCDYCGESMSQMPWHGSGVINGIESRHIHACDKCREKLPANT